MPSSAQLMTQENTHTAHRRFTPVVSAALALVWVLLWPGFASASIIVSNTMEGAVGESVVGPQLFSYHEGTEADFNTSFDFDQGIYVDTELDPTNEFVQLSAPDGAWWDLDWGARRCFDVTNPDVTLLEHQVRVVFDSSMDMLDGLLQTNGEDYRALAEDDITELDFWIESGVGTTETVAWVQMDLIGFNDTRFCLYFDNATALADGSQEEVFSYDTPKQLFYALSPVFDGSAGVNGSLDIVSFVNGNSVNVDGDIRAMNAGDVQRFTNVSPTSVILTTGPIAGRGIGGGQDSIAPVSFAGTIHIFPTNRHTQQWALVSPSGAAANVTITDGVTTAWTGVVAGTTIVQAADISAGNSAIITSDVPILVNHTSTNGNDALVVPPFLGDDLYGVLSRVAFASVAIGPGDFDIFYSDGGFDSVVALPVGDRWTMGTTTTNYDGDGEGIRITNMTRPTGALQQADRDGNESTAFLPERLLENQYYLPTSAQYVAFACPTSMTINVGAQQVPCSPLVGGAPGHGVSGAAAAGERIWSDTGANFYAYYEDAANNDETNLFGMKVASNYTDVALVLADGALELAPAGFAGTWTSPAINTSAAGSNVFGLLSLLADVPADTGVRMYVARADTEALALIAPFVGPDGTAATSFGVGENVAPYEWDFDDEWLVVRLELSTMDAQATPLVDRVTLGYDLPEQGPTSLHLVTTDGPTSDRDYVLRVWTEDISLTASTATMTHLETMGLNAASAMVMSIETTPQIVINTGMVTQDTGVAVTVGPGTPSSVIVDSSNMIGADLTAVWQTRLAGSGIIVQHQLTVAFS